MFPNVIHAATTATRSKAKATANNKLKVVHIQQGIVTAHKLVEKIWTTGFYPAIKGKGKKRKLKRRRKEEFHNLQFIRKGQT